MGQEWAQLVLHCVVTVAPGVGECGGGGAVSELRPGLAARRQHWYDLRAVRVPQSAARRGTEEQRDERDRAQRGRGADSDAEIWHGEAAAARPAKAGHLLLLQSWHTLPISVLCVA